VLSCWPETDGVHGREASFLHRPQNTWTLAVKYLKGDIGSIHDSTRHGPVYLLVVAGHQAEAVVVGSTIKPREVGKVKTSTRSSVLCTAQLLLSQDKDKAREEKRT